MIRFNLAKLKGTAGLSAVLRYVKQWALRFVNYITDPQHFGALLIFCAVLSMVNYLILMSIAGFVATTTPKIISTVTATLTAMITGTPTTTPTSASTSTPTTAPTITSTPPWDVMVDSYFATMPYPFMRYPEDWTVSADGVQFASFWEGYVGTPYDDGGPGVGNCTIGFGHLIHLGPCSGSEGGSISYAQAYALLEDELNHCGSYVPKYVHVRVSQNQYNVLAGLVCGVGYDRFAKYEFTRLLNEGRYYAAAQKLKETGTYGIGIGLCPGLVRRRAVEAEKFIAFAGVTMWPFIERK